VRDLSPLAESAQVSVATSLGEGDIDGSGTLIRQLVSNLLLNGIRHNSDNGGWLEVSTQTAEDGSVELSVVNSGPVVSPELRARMTEPFVRGAGRVSTRTGARGTPEGSGLGLALVARVADVHGATLRLEARQAGGLAATVRFPSPGTSPA
jgi:two-component system sensor histidine kinase VanS